VQPRGSLLRRDDAGDPRTFRRRAMYETLMEQAVADENYAAALAAVKRNHGAAGIDRMTTAQLEIHLKANGWDPPRQTPEGTYVPSPVRRVEIPKPTGGTRMLGIRTVQDRFIQQLLLQAMTPIFDPHFSEHSYGFRPGRSAQDAVRAAQQYAQGGKEWVVDIDITKFFDQVNHDILMGRIGVTIRDKRVLRFDREIPAAGSDGGWVGGSERGGHAARRAAISAAGEHLSGCTGQGTGEARAPILPIRG
jgi:RNA-directed DNA polymerase